MTDAAATKAPKKLKAQFEYANPHQVPGLTKIVVNMGVGEAAKDGKLIDAAVKDLTAITGQKPQINLARKSIAQFKLREGQPIGAHVTLRGDRMWEFLDRLLTLALPRIRDFRGLNGNQFDGRGNYTFGLSEQNVFHEINQDSITRSYGMDITVVTTATNNEEGHALLTGIAEILKAEGYIAGFQVADAEVGKTLTVDLKFGPNRERSIAGIKRVSKPGLRVYAKSTELPRVLGGLGIAILSTSSGLLTDRQAAKKGVGGEVLAYVW